MKRNISVEDVQKGDAVYFYQNGLRTDLVIRVQKKKNGKGCIIHTERYGKIPFDDIQDVCTYDENGLKQKPIIGDLFI